MVGVWVRNRGLSLTQSRTGEWPRAGAEPGTEWGRGLGISSRPRLAQRAGARARRAEPRLRGGA